jgi:hypothetical protein
VGSLGKWENTSGFFPIHDIVSDNVVINIGYNILSRLSIGNHQIARVFSKSGFGVACTPKSSFSPAPGRESDACFAGLSYFEKALTKLHLKVQNVSDKKCQTGCNQVK